MKFCQVGSTFVVYVLITRNAMEHFSMLNHGSCRLLHTDEQIYTSSGTHGVAFDRSASHLAQLNLLCSMSMSKIVILLMLTSMPSLSPCEPLL